jgi:hypothetical protein
VLEEIPRTSRGKVNRAQIAEHCGTRRPIDITSLIRAEKAGEEK